MNSYDPDAMKTYEAVVMLKTQPKSKMFEIEVNAFSMVQAERFIRESVKDAYGERESEECKIFEMKQVA